MSDSNSKPDTAASGDGHAAHGPHVVSPRILLSVYAALICFTGITFGVSKLDLGQFNIWVALAVAVIKVSLVMLFFMHLRWDAPFNSVILITAFIFVALFIGLALLDAHSYEPLMKPTPTAIGP